MVKLAQLPLVIAVYHYVTQTNIVYHKAPLIAIKIILYASIIAQYAFV